MGNGYQTFAGNFGGALLLKSSKALGDFEAYYMNAKKTNDNTVKNRKGHERFLLGRVFYPWRRGFYFGGGHNGVKLRQRITQRSNGDLRSA